MRPTIARCLQLLDRSISQSRAKSISFIGLGRMGSEMAFNLFSKKFIEAGDSQFLICDAVPDNAKSFRENFLAQFPGAQIGIATTPEEYVCCFIIHRTCIIKSRFFPAEQSSPRCSNCHYDATIVATSTGSV